MKWIALFVALALLAGPIESKAENPLNAPEAASSSSSTGNGSAVTLPARPEPHFRPFSVGASTGSVSSLGGQFQIASNLNSRMNLRTGFSGLYWKKWVTYDGFNGPASVSLISQSTAIDFYPIAGRGFRLSPGFLIHNAVPASSSIQLGPANNGTFVLNGHTYYSAYTPVANPSPFTPPPGPEPPKVIEQLHLPNTAFTMTAGWSSIIPRGKNASWTFPFEAGVAFLGSPALRPTGIQGQICDAQFQNCRDAASDAQFMNDLQAHFATYADHLSLLKTYPIVSFGVAHTFGFRRSRF